MFTHVMLGSNDIARSKKFYDATFAAFGGPEGVTDPKGRLIYQHNGGIFILTLPIDGNPACFANGGTIGFGMTPEQANAWHAAGVANGGVRRPAGTARGQPVLPRLSARSGRQQAVRAARSGLTG